MSYSPKTYWERRHAAHADLRGTGHLGHGHYYNWWLYRAKVRALHRAFQMAAVRVKGSSVLDVGAGTGFFLSLYAQWGAGRLAGIDISPTSVRRLNETLPNATVWVGDVARGVPTDEQFDIVQALDVLYHLPDSDFYPALGHLLGRCRPGGILLATDSLRTQGHPAAHVFFRNLRQYQDTLAEWDVDLIGVVPIYRFLNRRGWAGSRSLFQRAAGTAVDAFAPVWYLVDAIALSPETANLSLLICRVRIRT